MRRITRRTLLSTTAAAAVMATTRCSEPRSGRVSFVLVHGAWAGGWAWKRVAPLLRAQGQDVFTPTLTGLGERVHLARPDVNLDTHIQDIVNLLVYEDLADAILVGWSYSGMVVSGVLDRVPDRLAHAVYLDAEVPRDGESDFDVSGQEFREEMERSLKSGEGWKASLGNAEAFDAVLGPWLPDMETRQWLAAKLASNGQPIETFRQPVRLSNPAADRVARTFIRCPVDGAIWASIYDPIVERLRKDHRWRVTELASNHLAPLAHPDLVADALLAIVDQLSAGA
jgi:pimeloyl-ACP methyl ester carboxylesterase